MPNFDGTGPRGEGPMTGWGRGYCVIPLSDPGQELGYLKSQEQSLKMQLKRLRARIRALETPKEVHHART
ncbi:MAG: DUF5320 domain-containing protein [Dehalococcoidia bacterium]|nr:DUF5320 domain-containing protein [Dehalococcoidia bacterium]